MQPPTLRGYFQPYRLSFSRTVKKEKYPEKAESGDRRHFP